MSFRVLGRENVEDILGEILERLRRLEHGSAAYPAPGIAPVHTADDHTTAIEVWDEGVDQGDVRILDFIGSGVLAQRFGDRATITITSGGAGGHTIEENGTPLTARTGLNFAEGLVASDDAGNDETDVNADWATTEIADIAVAESPGVGTKIPRADHVHAHGSGYAGGHSDYPTVPGFGSPTASVDIGDAQADGVSTSVPRADHQHAHAAPGAGYPLDVAVTEADGVATTPARSDHVHGHGSGYVGGHTDVAAHSIIGAEHTSFPGGTTTFLRADGTFAAPPGGGSGDLLVAWVGL